jgi:hypothetical protein
MQVTIPDGLLGRAAVLAVAAAFRLLRCNAATPIIVLDDGDGFREAAIHPAILPDGQISESCPAPPEKIFLFSTDPNQV